MVTALFLPVFVAVIIVVVAIGLLVVIVAVVAVVVVSVLFILLHNKYTLHSKLPLLIPWANLAL